MIANAIKLVKQKWT